MQKLITPTMGIFGPCRLSYLTVFKPRMNELKKEEQYSVVLLFPKKDNDFCKDANANIQFVAQMIKTAAAEKFGDSVKKYEIPMKDGDVETDSEGEPKHPGYRYMRVMAKVEYPPVLIDGNRRPVTGGWESGDWGIIKCSFFGYDFQGKKGVSVGLRAIQFVAKDEPFGSSSDPATVANEFDEVAGYVAPNSSTSDEEDDPFA